MINVNYRSIIENSPIGYAYHKVICDEKGLPCDYEFSDVNIAFGRLTGIDISNLVGKKISEIITDKTERDFWIKLYGDIALNGGSKQFQQYSDALKRHYQIYAYSPEKGRFITWLSDVSDLKMKTEELERFFDINLDLLCIADLEGNFIKVNKAWEKILGYLTKDLENRKFLDFVHPEDLDATLNALKKLGQNEQVLNFVNRYKSYDGSYRYIEWRSQPHGNLVYAAARDITDRKMMEETLLISEERFNVALEGTRAGLWDWYTEDNKVFYSPQWKEMLGYKQNEVEDTFEGWKNLCDMDEPCRYTVSPSTWSFGPFL
jgi:PAS domain S-box-containing protein